MMLFKIGKGFVKSIPAAIIVFILLMQLIPSDQVAVEATDAPTDGDGNEYFPLMSSISKCATSSTSWTQGREVMTRDGQYLYLGYSDEPTTGNKGLLLTRSDDNGTTWEDPIRIWPLKDIYGMMIGLEVIDGTLI